MDGTRTYSWDAESRLVGIGYPGKASAFTYDGLGRRTSIAETPPGGGTKRGRAATTTRASLRRARPTSPTITAPTSSAGGRILAAQKPPRRIPLNQFSFGFRPSLNDTTVTGVSDLSTIGLQEAVREGRRVQPGYPTLTCRASRPALSPPGLGCLRTLPICFHRGT